VYACGVIGCNLIGSHFDQLKCKSATQDRQGTDRGQTGDRQGTDRGTGDRGQTGDRQGTNWGPTGDQLGTSATCSIRAKERSKFLLPLPVTPPSVCHTLPHDRTAVNRQISHLC
jgi:hypothetical protein